MRSVFCSEEEEMERRILVSFSITVALSLSEKEDLQEASPPLLLIKGKEKAGKD